MSDQKPRAKIKDWAAGTVKDEPLMCFALSAYDGRGTEFVVDKSAWPRMLTGLIFASFSEAAKSPKEWAEITIDPRNVPMATVGFGTEGTDTLLTVGVGDLHIPFRIEVRQLEAALEAFRNRSQE